MQLRIASDLHLEDGQFGFPSLPTDPETVLILAGDIGVPFKSILMAERLLSLLTRCEAQFKAVIYVLGNHDHWYGAYGTTVERLRELVDSAGLRRVYVLQNEVKVIENVAFVGTTLWTDAANRSPYAQIDWHLQMNDAKRIRIGPSTSPYQRKFQPSDLYNEHVKAKEFIRSAVLQARIDSHKQVVVTHHAVSERSIPEKFKDSPLSVFYFSHLDEFFEDLNPDLIIHGHVHQAQTYNLCEDLERCKTKVVVNPRGYSGETASTGFDPCLLINI